MSTLAAAPQVHLFFLYSCLCACSLPAQPINVTIDPVNLAVVHAIAKYLTRLAPGWELGNDYIIQWPSCTHLMNSLYGHTNQSRPFETNYTFG